MSGGSPVAWEETNSGLAGSKWRKNLPKYAHYLWSSYFQPHTCVFGERKYERLVN